VTRSTRVYPAGTLNATTPAPSARALLSRSVHLLAFLSVSSGMPLGWVYVAFQFFLIGHGISKAEFGVISGVSVAWTVKFLWSPLVDRYALRWPGRRRSWVVMMQLALAATFGAFALYAWRVEGMERLAGLALGAAAFLGFLVAFFSATQDIALDAYAVELLKPEEREPASGLRILWYRLGMLLAGAVLVSLSDYLSWPSLFLGLAAIFVGFVGITLLSPEPERPTAPPRTLGSAIVDPILHYFRRPDAIAVALFLVFYKFGDNMGGTMVNYFLKDLCFSNTEAGAAIKVIGTFASIGGSLLGAAVMMRIGLGRALWTFGLLQAGANLLYSVAAGVRGQPLDLHQCAGLPVLDVATRAWTYASIACEHAAQGMGTAAQAVLLLRVCDKRYSATQFALLSSLFALGRWSAGLPSGWMVERMGYPLFFAACATVFAIPGFVFLQRIAPFGRRDVRTAEAEPILGPPT
jgi:PAT family beta-lactamase induction signal transducer AmpG